MRHGKHPSPLTIIAALAIPAMLGACSRISSSEPRSIVHDGESDFRIVVAPGAPASTRHAARELRHFLRRMTGVRLPMTTDRQSIRGPEIIVGDNEHLRLVLPDLDLKALGPEGYVLRTAGPHLVIAGGEPRGTLYGVYGFLHEHLGCRWFTPEVSQIPSRDEIVVGLLDETQVPAFEYRAPAVMDGPGDPEWCARNRVNTQCLRWVGLPGAPPDRRFRDHHAPVQWWGGGLGVHTFFKLLPPETYFEDHPEYYSLIDGERRWAWAQLCVTNEDVLRVATEEVLRRIREDPDARYYDVSQMDWWNPCQCENCHALAEREGSQAAPVLQFVNRIAEAVEQEFPDKIITTLAYQWTRKPPESLRARANVMVRLCTIECDFALGVARSDYPSNVALREEIQGWARQCDRLFVWNYTTNFHNYYMPQPTLRALDDDLQFFQANNVQGVYEQDTQMTPHGDMSALGAYMMARFLWDPTCDEDTVIDEFLEGVYGSAAPPVRQYIDLLHDKVENDGVHVSCWGSNREKFLTAEILEQSERLWDEAERLAAGDDDCLNRVRFDRLSHDNAMLWHIESSPAQRYVFDHEDFRVAAAPEYEKRVEGFIAMARQAGFITLRESFTPLETYARQLRESVLSQLPESLSDLRPQPPVDPAPQGLQPGLDYAYQKGTFEALPDPGSMVPDGGGFAPSITLEVDKPETYYTIRYRGWLQAPRDGVYAFSVVSDDGSRLCIDDNLVLDSPGNSKRITGFAALRAGWHRVEASYYMGQTANLFDVTWLPPGADAFSSIPPERFGRR